MVLLPGCVCCSCDACLVPCWYQIRSGEYAVSGPFPCNASPYFRSASSVAGDYYYSSWIGRSGLDVRHRCFFARSRQGSPITSVIIDTCPNNPGHGRSGTGAQANVSHLSENNSLEVLISCDIASRKLFFSAVSRDTFSGAGLSYLPAAFIPMYECFGRPEDLNPSLCGPRIVGTFYQGYVQRTRAITLFEIPSECISGELTFPNAACAVEISQSDGVTITAGGSAFTQPWQSVSYEGSLSKKEYDGQCYLFDWSGATVITGPAMDSMVTSIPPASCTIEKVTD